MKNYKKPLPQYTLGEGEIEVIKLSKEVSATLEDCKTVLIIEDKDGTFWTLPKREKP
jgi:hypothetical protein